MTEPQLPLLRRLHLWESPTLHGRPETDLPVEVVWDDREFDEWHPSNGGVILFRYYTEEQLDLARGKGEKVYTQVARPIASVKGTHLFKFWLEEYYPEAEPEPIEPVTPPWQDATFSQPTMDEKDDVLHVRALEYDPEFDQQELTDSEELVDLGHGPLPRRTPGTTEIPPVPINQLPFPAAPPGVISDGRDSFLDTGSILIAPLAAPAGNNKPELTLPKTNGLISGITPGDHEPIE